MSGASQRKNAKIANNVYINVKKPLCARDAARDDNCNREGRGSTACNPNALAAKASTDAVDACARAPYSHRLDKVHAASGGMASISKPPQASTQTG